MNNIVMILHAQIDTHIIYFYILLYIFILFPLVQTDQVTIGNH